MPKCEKLVKPNKRYVGVLCIILQISVWNYFKVKIKKEKNHSSIYFSWKWVLAAHGGSACNPHTSGGSPELRSLRSSLSTWWNPFSIKYTKISWAWWHMPEVPGTLRLRWKNHWNPRGKGRSEPRWCHCTPAWAIEWDSIPKQEKKKKYLKVKWGH